MRTDNLIEKLITAEKLNPTDITLVSQWDKDLKMGTQLGIATCTDAKSYFNATAFKKNP